MQHLRHQLGIGGNVELDHRIDAFLAGERHDALADILALVVDGMVGAGGRRQFAFSGELTVVMTVAPAALANWIA